MPSASARESAVGAGAFAAEMQKFPAPPGTVDEDERAEEYDLFEDTSPKKGGVKARKLQRRRSTMRVFQKNEAARRKGGGQQSSSAAGSADIGNTQINLPYSLINLAVDRHSNRHVVYEPGGKEAAAAAAATQLAPPRNKMLSVSDSLNDSDFSDGGSRRSSARSRRPSSRGLFRKKSGTIDDMEDAIVQDEDAAIKGNELGLAYQSWMESHLNMYHACVKPVAQEKNKNKCKCNRDLEFWGPHSIKKPKKDMFDVVVDTQTDEPGKWTPDTNMSVDSTTAYGLMLFREEDPDFDLNGDINMKHVYAGKPYVRVCTTDCVQHPEYIRDMLVNKWDLDPPRILLAVTGGAMAFDLPPKLDERIKIGLRNAAKTESLWITSGGSNSGVMQYVGDAINGPGASEGSTCPVVALANWGIVMNSEKLETYPDGKPVQGGLVYYGRITDKSPGLMLDQNHSHYILVDGGKKMGFGDEIASRAAIEGAVAKLMSTGKFGSESPVSTVLLSIQGGPGTVGTILESLKMNTPVVVVNGSGKSSSAVAYAKEMPQEGERENASGNSEAGLDELICNEFGVHITSPTFRTIKDKTMECVKPQYRELIHVYNVDYEEVGGEVKALDVDLLDAVLEHNVDQWDTWSANRSQDLDPAGEVEENLKRRDLSRVLVLELSVMWKRLDVIAKELESYGVLPTLAKRKEKMLYCPLDDDITYMSNMREEVIIKKKETIELIKIRGESWLVKPATEKNDLKAGWVLGKKFHIKGGHKCFADVVTLAQLKMLQFLLLHERRDFVQLFLQGMREDDVTAFLGLRIRTVWYDAAMFGFKSGTEEEAIAPTQIIVKDKKKGKKKWFLNNGDNTDQGKATRRTSLNAFANRPAEFSRAASTISHVSDLSTEEFGDEASMFKIREEAARAMLAKNAQSNFDESDVALPPYATSGWIATIADEHLTAWVNKKWAQKKQGFQMSDSTLALICGRSKHKPRQLHIDMLGKRQQDQWQQKSEWFLKLLSHKGYIISQEQGQALQLDSQGGITRIHDWDLLVDTISQTRHSLWLRKKLEERWAYGEYYDADTKTSPYIHLFADLDEPDQQYLAKYSILMLRVLLQEGFWIWRPDMLERLYYEAAIIPSNSHVLRLFKKGMFWRSNLLNVIAYLMGPAYIHDFSTFSALDPYYHLIVWAIICKKFTLVKDCWERRKVDCIANGLVAATLAKKICIDPELSPELKSVYKDQVSVFKARSLGVFQECVNRDSTQTEQVLLGRYPTAGWLTLWELAFGLEKDENEGTNEKKFIEGVALTSDAFTSQDLYVKIVKQEWFGLVSKENGLMKILLFLPLCFMTMFYVDSDLPPGATQKTWFQRYLAPLTMAIDTSCLKEVVSPTISWSPTSKKITLRTPTVGATIIFTTDGRDPAEFGKRYVPSKRGHIVNEQDAQNALELPSNIELPGEDLFIIKCYAKKKGLNDSTLTEKEVNCDYKDMVNNTVPAFSIGPPPSKAHWQRYGGFGTAAFRMYSFYSAPYVTFWFHLTLNMIYILLFSYSAIVPTYVLEVDTFRGVSDMELGKSLEIIVPLVVFGWTAILATDEARQAYGLGLSDWWSSFWNKIDFVLYLNTLIVGMLRLNWDGVPFFNRSTGNPRRQWGGSDRLMLARCMLALGALGLWMRLLRMYSYSESLGPKLVMIGKMIADVAVFLSLLIVALVGYGVAMHAIMDPWRGVDRQSFMTIIFKPFFQMIGETFLEEIGSHSDCLGEDFTQCNDSHSKLVVFLCLVYLIFSNIMLVNLLIAMMAATYERVDKVAKNLWSVQYVDLLEEFSELLPIPPPFSFFYNTMMLLIAGLGKFVNMFKKKNNKVFPGEEVQKKGDQKGQIDARPGAKPRGLAYVEQLRGKRELAFTEDCFDNFIRRQAERDQLQVAKKDILNVVSTRFTQMDQLVKNIEFNVGELLKDAKKAESSAIKGSSNSSSNA